MSFNVDQAISAEIAPGERLLWSGRPAGGILFHRGDVFLIPFSLLWAGFAIFWEITAARSRAGAFFSLWGLAFVLIGLYFVAGRFIVDAWQRGQTAYGLTNQRAIIVSRALGGGRRVKSLPLRALSEVTLSERPDGSGTITLGQVAGLWTMAFVGDAAWPGVPRPPRFEMIPHVREVYDQLRQAQRGESQTW